jgi:hypothetical protein
MPLAFDLTVTTNRQNVVRRYIMNILTHYIYELSFFFNSWFRASWFNINKKNQLDASVCRNLFTATSNSTCFGHHSAHPQEFH